LSSTDSVLLAIEGNSGVGKTTTASAIARRLGVRWFPEPGMYIDERRGERVPDFPGRDGVAAAAAATIWLLAEQRRQAQMRREAAAAQVIDCTTVSVLAFELAKARVGFPNAMRPLAAGYQSLYEDGVLTEPTHWLFLTAPATVVLSRIAHRGGSRRFLRKADTIVYLDAVRRHFADVFLAPGRSAWLDNAGQAVEAAVDSAVALVSADAPVSDPVPVLEFLRRTTADDEYVEELLALGGRH
jgi:thymidylate kinase